MLQTASRWKTQIERGDADAFFRALYPDRFRDQSARYLGLLAEFADRFGETPCGIFSAPGRTELGGNHTDHQRGHVLAGAVTMDMIAVAAPRSDTTIHLISRGFEPDCVDTADLAVHPDEISRSAALIRGVAAGFAALGLRTGGIDAVQSSDIPTGSGLSSSAAFEVLAGMLLRGLYNGDQAPDLPTVARIGQAAENRWFGKPCGLMDQMACALGSVVAIDFVNADSPVFEQIPVDFEAHGYTLCLVNAGGSHADLSDEYAAIPAEMRAVAAALGSEVLSQVSPKDFFEKIGSIRAQTGDRALLRAMHFFADDACVLEEVAALRSGDYARFCALMNASGDSSLRQLQNIYPAASAERSVSLALALSKQLLGGQGACRVHGGGFAGTIQVLVPTAQLAAYLAAMEQVFSPGCCYPASIRPRGGLVVPADFHL